jgi:uncharacterized membrane protein YoaK (UPF0700 family)
VVSRTFFADPRHGPLPGLLIGLTVVSGVVDAVSILSLGRVFVANMTGNVVFIGFAAAGAPGFSLSASLIALAGFLAGAAGGGIVSRRYGHDRPTLLLSCAAGEFVLVMVALAITASTREPFDMLTTNVVAAAMALAMGAQNAIARRIAVPDLTTTVLTMTLTGIFSDLRAGAKGWPQLLRRFMAVAAMFIGAIVGAVLVLQTRTAVAIGLAAALVAAVGTGAAITTRQAGSWRALQPG